MSPRVTEQIGRALTAQAWVRARRMAAEDAAAMVAEVNAIVRTEYPRREGRSHKANTTHLHESFTFKVVDGPRGPQAILTIKPGVSAAKIAALEFGSRPHDIDPRNGDTLAWRAPSGAFVRTPRVGAPYTAQHPGNPPGRFMERARRRVVDRRRARGR